MALRYFYQTDLNGNPIQGSNVAIKRKPIVGGKGQRWVEFTPIAMDAPCCVSGGTPFASTGRKWRYYVRIAETTNLPISGTLEKRRFPPTSYRWQEVDGNYCC
jgi:hypothetical protein